MFSLILQRQCIYSVVVLPFSVLLLNTIYEMKGITGQKEGEEDGDEGEGEGDVLCLLNFVYFLIFHN